MEDYQIVDLYWQRSENAIAETDVKYGRMLASVSRSLLDNCKEDAEEALNDTYMCAWRQMPSDRPVFLGAYLSKIIRALSISAFRKKHREKRGGAGALAEELTECIPDGRSLEEEYENGRLANAINRFLCSLDEEKRRIFTRRYFFSDSVSDIADDMGISVPKVKTTLFRLRAELKNLLEKEELM